MPYIPRRKRNSKPGFTLIELLVVVSVIGILSILFIQNSLTAINKARQKGTQKDLMKIGMHISNYSTDHGRTPAWDGSVYTKDSSIYTALVPFYVKGIPVEDRWGHSFRIYSGESWSSAWLGMTPSSDENNDFALGSPGKEGSFNFDYSSSGVYFYSNDSLEDFNNDIVMWNENWVCVARKTTDGS